MPNMPQDLSLGGATILEGNCLFKKRIRLPVLAPDDFRSSNFQVESVIPATQ
jgi:hypothetical protein